MSRRSIGFLFAAAILSRLVVLFTGPWIDPARVFPFSPDSARYVVLADELLAHQTFGKPVEDGLMHEAVAKLRAANGTLPPPDANGLYPEAFRTPGYPLFLAVCSGRGGLGLALLAQCL